MSRGGGSFVVNGPSLGSSDILRHRDRPEAEWAAGDGPYEGAFIHVQQPNVYQRANRQQDCEIRDYGQCQGKSVREMSDDERDAANRPKLRDLPPRIVDAVSRLGENVHGDEPNRIGAYSCPCGTKHSKPRNE